MYLISVLVDKQKLEEKGDTIILTPSEMDRKNGKFRQIDHERTEGAFSFNIRDEKEVRKHLLENYGPGYYRIYRWGGFPPHEEFLNGDDGTPGPDIVDGRRI